MTAGATKAGAVRYYRQGRLVAGSPDEAVKILRERYGYCGADAEGECCKDGGSLVIEQAWQMPGWYEWTMEVVEPQGDYERLE